MYAGTYESHPVAIKKHKMDGSMMDSKALIEFEFEVRRRGAVAVVPVYHAGGEGRSAYTPGCSRRRGPVPWRPVRRNVVGAGRQVGKMTAVHVSPSAEK